MLMRMNYQVLTNECAQSRALTSAIYIPFSPTPPPSLFFSPLLFPQPPAVRRAYPANGAAPLAGPRLPAHLCGAFPYLLTLPLTILRLPLLSPFFSLSSPLYRLQCAASIPPTALLPLLDPSFPAHLCGSWHSDYAALHSRIRAASVAQYAASTAASHTADGADAGVTGEAGEAGGREDTPAPAAAAPLSAPLPSTNSSSTSPTGPPPLRFLTYDWLDQCGGLGDSLVGLATSFAVALLDGRAFLIRHACLPWAFQPALVDWTLSPDVPLSPARAIPRDKLSDKKHWEEWQGEVQPGEVLLLDLLNRNVNPDWFFLDGKGGGMKGGKAGGLSRNAVNVRVRWNRGMLTRMLAGPWRAGRAMQQQLVAGLAPGSDAGPLVTVGLHIRVPDADVAWQERAAQKTQREGGDTAGATFAEVATGDVPMVNVTTANVTLANVAIGAKEEAAWMKAVRKWLVCAEHSCPSPLIYVPFSLQPFSLHPFSLHPFSLHPFSLHPFSLHPFSLHPCFLHPCSSAGPSGSALLVVAAVPLHAMTVGLILGRLNSSAHSSIPPHLSLYLPHAPSPPLPPSLLSPHPSLSHHPTIPPVPPVTPVTPVTPVPPDRQWSASGCRRPSPGVRLRGVRLRGVRQRGVRLRGVRLRGVRLRGVRLRGVRLRGVRLRGVRLRGVRLRGVRLRGVRLRGVRLRGVRLRGVRLRGVRLRGVCLRGVCLRGVRLRAPCMLMFSGGCAAVCECMRGCSGGRSSVTVREVQWWAQQCVTAWEAAQRCLYVGLLPR
ncbi:unnamed protein product [Closterium sp. NIES-65]|nr:unnamed protein product [Closterium sp. NIES-65]